MALQALLWKQRCAPRVDSLTLGLRRIELCREDGSKLRTVLLDECTGAPHEFRGVYRGGLLRTLQSAVPPDSIRYGAAVESVDQDATGVDHPNTDCSCGIPLAPQYITQAIVSRKRS